MCGVKCEVLASERLETSPLGVTSAGGMGRMASAHALDSKGRT
jgi:hypothetical protein